MKFKHFETESGKTIKTAQFDGYSIGDRLLEGLMFQVDIQDDGTMKVYVKPNDQKWFDQFNTTKWLKEAQEFAEKNDIFEDPTSGEDCWLVTDEVTSVVQNTGRVIKSSTIDEILNSKKNIDNLDKVSKSLDLDGYAIIDEENKTDEEVEVKEPVIGKYKPKRKFLNFVTGLKGRVRLLNNVAFMKGEQLSGMLEGAIFKITICDEGTINFEEMDTNFSTPEMIQRFIDDIDSRDVTGYTQKFVVSGLEFQDDDAKLCYLEVEHKKPIDMLFSLFDEDKSQQITENGMSILDALFSSESDEELQRELEGESDEEIKAELEKNTDPVETESIAQRMMRESFEKMNAEKAQELKNRIEKTEKEIKKLQLDIKQAESKLNTSGDDLRILNTRLESLSPKDSSVGYDFFVSEENKTGIEPDENLVQVVEKIAPLLKLNTPVVIDMLTKGYYTIKIQKQGEVENKQVLDKEVYQKIQKIDVTGKVTMVAPCEFEYRGDMTWHQLVDKMIRMGFDQNPDFDKDSGSNSYESKEEEKESMEDMKNDIMKMADSLGIKDMAEKHLQDIESDVKFKELMTFDTPTDIVIYGNYDDLGTEFMIDDDETSFDLYVNGEEKMTLSSTGFGGVLTLEDYMKLYSKRGEEMAEWGIVEGVVVSNFQGTIGIGAMDEDGDISSEFDIDDYIQHQGNDDDYSYRNVIINVPGTHRIFKLNEDLSVPLSEIRDIKIDTIIK
jgi:uncharacterized protein (UPF0335 family)